MSDHDPVVPAALIGFFAAVFFVLERIQPGRRLPPSPGWYARAALLNVVQVVFIVVAGLTWNRYFSQYVLFHHRRWPSPVMEGAFYWFAGTFIFYWWHRLRHVSGFWEVFHQIHHSPARIEVLTAFYKHPGEIVANSMLTGFFIYSFCGSSPEAGAWTAFFGTLGEYFYHSNLRTPHWIGWFIQRPEHHSIHHQLGVHNFNFGDVTLWDRIFGTFRDTDAFAEHCGFAEHREERLAEMLVFQDVNR